MSTSSRYTHQYKKKSNVKRILYNLPEITISFATIVAVITLFSYKPTEDTTVEQKKKIIKQVREISYFLTISSSAYIVFKTLIYKQLEVFDVLLVAQAFPFYASMMIASNVAETELDSTIETLKNSMWVSVFVQSILRIRSFSCTVV